MASPSECSPQHLERRLLVADCIAGTRQIRPTRVYRGETPSTPTNNATTPATIAIPSTSASATWQRGGRRSPEPPAPCVRSLTEHSGWHRTGPMAKLGASTELAALAHPRDRTLRRRVNPPAGMGAASAVGTSVAQPCKHGARPLICREGGCRQLGPHRAEFNAAVRPWHVGNDSRRYVQAFGKQTDCVPPVPVTCLHVGH